MVSKMVGAFLMVSLILAAPDGVLSASGNKCGTGSLSCDDRSGGDRALLQTGRGMQKVSKSEDALDVEGGTLSLTSLAGVRTFNWHNRNYRASLGRIDLEAGVTDWLIFMKKEVSEDVLHRICQALGTKKCLMNGHPSKRGLPFIDLEADDEELAQIVRKYKDLIAFVEPDSPIEVIPEVPNREGANLMQSSGLIWNLDRIDDREGFDGSYETFLGLTGEGVHVYVTDTGLDTAHPDFEGRAVATLEVLSSNLRVCNGATDCAVDSHGHGTHCAGTVGGKMHGVAKGATIHGVKIMADDGRGSSSWWLAAVDWILSQGEKPAVVSASLGAPDIHLAYQTGIDAAVEAGVTVVVAAGNDNSDACTHSPAFVPSAITVGSSGQTDSRSAFSNYGSCVNMFAPGESIKSTLPGGGLGYMSGTSMACPHVAGVAAIAVQHSPSLSGVGVAAILKQWSTKGKLGDAQGSSNEIVYNGVDAQELGPTPPPTPAPTPACVGDSETWDAGWGGCWTYAPGATNGAWCQYDSVGEKYAFQVCEECGWCVAAAPTSAPTLTPTPAPTQSPTPLPTPSPTQSPTPSPTQSPTPAPTPSQTPAPTGAPTTENFVVTVGGCPTKSGAPTQQCESVAGADSDLKAVRCCNEAGTKVWMTSTYGCFGNASFAEAKSRCEENSLHLCSVDELTVQCGTGCSFDKKRVWTATPCDPNPSPAPSQTPAPTQSPTLSPTQSPTQSPTLAPQPTPTPTEATSAAVSTQAWDHFALINELRRDGFQCGSGDPYPPNETPLKFDCRLWRAAQLHSQDMADQDYFSHTSLDGRSPWQRAEEQGISANGENIAAGRSTPAGVLDQWKASDGHCHNMMNPQFTLFAIGYGYNAGATYKHYWTQMFKTTEVPVDTSCHPASTASVASAGHDEADTGSQGVTGEPWSG